MNLILGTYAIDTSGYKRYEGKHAKCSIILMRLRLRLFFIHDQAGSSRGYQGWQFLVRIEFRHEVAADNVELQSGHRIARYKSENVDVL